MHTQKIKCHRAIIELTTHHYTPVDSMGFSNSCLLSTVFSSEIDHSRRQPAPVATHKIALFFLKNATRFDYDFVFVCEDTKTDSKIKEKTSRRFEVTFARLNTDLPHTTVDPLADRVCGWQLVPHTRIRSQCIHTSTNTHTHTYTRTPTSLCCSSQSCCGSLDSALNPRAPSHTVAVRCRCVCARFVTNNRFVQTVWISLLFLLFFFKRSQ